ncbi:putative chaperone protein DNAj [Leptomonas pyrrhocoris]|uniref:Putative chaperone protein DNAj n=1 Tax=Leptomonas pyrrhocoris TaxID=157538 RepID=A0A0N0VFP5_LEPPY|nr:putative chaperone protein DNAj [Leptomonas pyrrhocoris]KPA81502.1 putative chaperone protein DNAj [Leptomonas pyrrhocoris]|eukprot:XP_015659941.1 putative chaperone protein DNAj [Leptomonas pyrrhocoris]
MPAMGATKFHLYTSLGVAKDSSLDEITRAYRRLALQFHPDRNPDGVEQFKAISNAYAVLSDTDRRAVYDVTGFVSDAAGDASHAMTDEATRQQRSAELADQVRDFFAAYAGSEEEVNDVVKGYVKCDGNFAKMVREYLLFDNGEASEVQRLHRLVEKLVAAGTLKTTAAWQASSLPKSILKIEKAMRRERTEAEEALKELAGGRAHPSMTANGGDEDGSLGALQLAIRQRQASSYQSMLSNLEAKYVTGKKKKSSASTRPREAELEVEAKKHTNHGKTMRQRDEQTRGPAKRPRH